LFVVFVSNHIDHSLCENYHRLTPVGDEVTVADEELIVEPAVIGLSLIFI